MDQLPMPADAVAIGDRIIDTVVDPYWNDAEIGYSYDCSIASGWTEGVRIMHVQLHESMAEVVGGPSDGGIMMAGFSVDLLGLVGHLADGPNGRGVQLLHLRSDGDLPTVVVFGYFEDVFVRIEILTEPPDEAAPQLLVDADTGAIRDRK